MQRRALPRREWAGWKLLVASGAMVISPGRRVQLATVDVRTGLVDAGKSGHLFSGTSGRVARAVANDGLEVILEPWDDADCAVFMQEDGKLFAMTRPRGASDWSLDGRTISDGLLHQGTEIIW